MPSINDIIRQAIRDGKSEEEAVTWCRRVLATKRGTSRWQLRMIYRELAETTAPDAQNKSDQSTNDHA